MKTLPALAALLFAYIAMAGPLPSPAAAPEALRAKHAELKEKLATSEFRRPLHLDSAEVTENLRGTVYAVISHPLDKVAAALREARNWCQVLVLPLHVKSCGTIGSGALSLRVTPRPDASESDGVALDFAFRVAAATAEHVQIEMTTPQGPVGTRDYRIVLDAIPVDARNTFVQLAYSYTYGTAAKLATQAYLSSSGKGKVGFTRAEGANGGFVGGMRGIVERNAMRYFLAIDAYLDSLAAPPAERLEKRLQLWTASLERYPRQLRESEPNYAALKREQMAAIRGS